MSDFGKWSEPNLPHKGWVCVGVEDLGTPSELCEMCDKMTIRYVHLMQHAEHPKMLRVGCVCAEHMSNDLVNPKLREQRLKNVAARRAYWTKRKWKVSQKGNPYLDVGRFNVVIFQGKKYGGWSGRIVERSTDATTFLPRYYQTADEAKLAVFDAMVFHQKLDQLED